MLVSFEKLFFVIRPYSTMYYQQNIIERLLSLSQTLYLQINLARSFFLHGESLLFLSFYQALLFVDRNDKWILLHLSDRMNGRQKYSRASYPVPFDTSTCRIRFARIRGLSILLYIVSRCVSSTELIPSRFSTTE